MYTPVPGVRNFTLNFLLDHTMESTSRFTTSLQPFKIKPLLKTLRTKVILCHTCEASSVRLVVAVTLTKKSQGRLKPHV